MQAIGHSSEALFIEQKYEDYTVADHQTWRTLFERMRPKWRRYANAHFLRGIDGLCLSPERVPRLEDVNRFLITRTGFCARAVSGYVPAFVFFDCLRNREFPTTVTVRPRHQLDYLPEPDIFHDIAGHVPMHTDPAFAAALVRFGDCAHAAAEIASGTIASEERSRRLSSRIQAMARFFWFTVEFGLMREGHELKAYGSGLLSSFGELSHSLESPEVQRSAISLEWIIHQSFRIDRYQPLLFIVESFDHLYELVDRLGQWMKQGRLDNVAPGEPAIQPDDLASFLIG
jgi:phenylalanine-4-hydroxylase